MIEPPELVAGKISVSKAQPKLIEQIGKKLRYPFLVGAGIKNAEDVKICNETRGHRNRNQLSNYKIQKPRKGSKGVVETMKEKILLNILHEVQDKKWLFNLKKP